MRVRMDIGAATKAARATGQSLDLLQSETQKYYEGEQLRRARMAQMKAANESESEMQKALEEAEQKSLTDPDGAENFFSSEVDRIKTTYTKSFANDDERELFGIKFDGSSNRFKSRVRTTARAHRLSINHGVWAETAQSLTERAYQGDDTGLNELFGNEELGIPSHFDVAVSEGYFDPASAQAKKKALRVDIAKQRLTNKFANAPLETLQGYLTDIESGKVPSDLDGEWQQLSPMGTDQFVSAIKTDIKSIETANKAADALLSDDQRTEYYKLAKNPETKLGDLTDMLTKFLTTDVEGMNNTDERAVISALTSAISSRGTERTSAITAIKDEKNDLMEILKGGMVPSKDRVNGLWSTVQSMQGVIDPDDARDVYNLKIAYDSVVNMNKMGNTELNAFLKSHFSATNNNATSADNLVQQQGRQIQNARRTGYDQNDAIGVAVRQGVIGAPPAINPFSLFEINNGEFAKNPDGSLRIDQEKMAAFHARKQTATVVQNAFGFGRKQFLDKNEAHQFRTFLDQTGPDSFGLRLSMLQTVVTGFGQDASSVLDEIVADDKKYGKYGHVGMLLVEGHAEAAEIALRGLDYLENGGAVSATKSEMDTAFKNYAKDSFYGIDGAGINTRKIAEAIYAHKAKSETMFDVDLFEDAIDMAVGAVGDRGGIKNVNGGKTVLPSNMTPARVERAIEQITLEQLQDPEVSGQNVTEKDVREINRGNWKLMLDPQSGKHQLYIGTISGEDVSGRMLSLQNDEDEPVTIDFENWQKKYGTL